MIEAAAIDRQILRIVDPAREIVAIQDDRRGDHWPRKGRATGLVHTGERLGEVEFELERAPARHRVAL
jgi:hypothetical protein